MTRKSLFLFAGEQSGDVLGSKLIQALKYQIPSLQLDGEGGDQMQTYGLTNTLDRFQVMGFSGVIRALPRLLGELHRLKKEILKKAFDGVVFIDYPDFSIRLARALRKEGYRGKLIHYVCPSVWAWRKRRVHTLAKTLDLLLTILPFEPSLFSQTALPTTYVGHPLTSAIDQHCYHPSWKELSDRPLVAIFPGSRPQEIKLNLPLQLKAMAKLAKNYEIAISVARPELNQMIREMTNALLVPAEFRYELMREATVAIATSGTVVLELGLHQVPTVVTYKIAPFNYLLARYIFRIHLPHYTLVNLICKETVYPEFIHKNLCEEKIYRALNQFIENPSPCQKACQRLRELLQNHDASMRAARAIEELFT